MNSPVLLRTVCDLKPAETMQERPSLRKKMISIYSKIHLLNLETIMF